MSIPQIPNLEVGVAVLSTQMLQLHTDVEGLKVDLRNHRQEHETEAAARAAGRRRLWSAVIVLIASIDGPTLAVLFARK